MTPRLVGAVAIGGAAGAALRYQLGVWTPTGSSFPWTIFAINVTGSLVLALLPALAVVRRSRTWTVALGPGVLGGYTTLSTASEQTRALLADDRTLLAGSYLIGTFAACLVAVAIASHWSTRAAQDVVAAEGGDE